MISTIVKCLLGPRLYRTYKTVDQEGNPYNGNVVERTSDTIIKWMKFCSSLCWWTSPVIGVILYRRSYFTVDGLISISKVASGLAIILAWSIICRGIGRLTNTDYLVFINALSDAKRTKNKKLVSMYDFDFSAWPIEYSWKDAYQSEGSKPTSKVNTSTSQDSLPKRCISYVAASTFGLRLAYPGYTDLINTLMFNMLLQGRTTLIEQKQAQRGKLLTEFGDEIDAVFVDRRSQTEKGRILVICCEGNAGFYEVGCMVSPMEAGYSVLGWNHPGFAGSTGVPFPPREQAAMDIVFQYAINKLGFLPENILLFAWSIGGYSAAWCAASYPDVKGLILDATFDTLDTLATTRMPKTWEPLVLMTIRNQINLNIAELVCQYHGPIRLIRRTKDEIISTSEGPVPELATNRGNFLLALLLCKRYPNIVNDETQHLLEKYLRLNKDDRDTLCCVTGVDYGICESMLKSYAAENRHVFPCDIGRDSSLEIRQQLTLFLASKYMSDFDSTHCTPLPSSFLELPWSAVS